MIPFTADPRGSAATPVSGASCCCQQLNLMPGETNLVQINYAPWSLPIGWLVDGLEYSIEADDSGCSKSAISGEVPPVAGIVEHTMDAGTVAAVDVSTDVTPVQTPPVDHSFSIVPMFGPYNGSAEINEDTGVITYTPRPGFEGYDVVRYKVIDRHGREDVGAVIFTVGSAKNAPDPSWSTTDPYLYFNKVITEVAYHTVEFPISMPPGAKSCERYRLTVKQPARDCNGTIFHHLMCFDIYPRACG